MQALLEQMDGWMMSREEYDVALATQVGFSTDAHYAPRGGG